MYMCTSQRAGPRSLALLALLLCCSVRALRPRHQRLQWPVEAAPAAYLDAAAAPAAAASGQSCPERARAHAAACCRRRREAAATAAAAAYAFGAGRLLRVGSVPVRLNAGAATNDAAALV